MSIQEIVAEILEHIRGMWRYRWWGAFAAWLISASGWFYVYTMPDVYAASARVYVDTQSLMGPVFQDLAIRDNLGRQVEIVSRALLTRPHLEAVARKSDLDLRADTPHRMERLITRLKEQISVYGNRDQDVFTIEYEDTNREKATEVVAAILDAFIETSLQGKGDDAEMTARALDAEIADHERRLGKAEQDLAQFKSANVGYMPDDRGDYYSRLQRALTDVRITEEQLRQVRERRDELQRQIAGEEPVLARNTGGIVAGCSQQAQITQLQAQLAALQVDFTEKHPRIVSLQESIAIMEAGCESERQTALAAGVSLGSLRDQLAEANPVYQNLRIQLSDAEVELAGLGAKLASERGVVAQLRNDVDRIAEVEANLKQLNRDYSVVHERFQELVWRRETLRSRERLDPVTESVKFRILEPPYASSEPVGPHRPILLLSVLIVATGAGVGLTFLLNQLKPVFFTRRSVKRIAGLPVLGSISMLLTPAQTRMRRLAAMLWAGVSVGLVAAAGALIVFESRAVELLQQVTERIGG